MDHEKLELTDEEIIRIREIILSQNRADWLWASIRKVAMWITAAVVAVTVSYDALKKFVKVLAGI